MIVSRKYSNGKISQPDDVLEAVKNLHNYDNLDLYNMSSHVLKQIAPILIVPLTHCFNLCLNYNYFPEELKIA